MQPGQLQVPLGHCWHVVNSGVPVQLETWNSVGLGGKRLVVPQQMRASGDVQSLSEVQLLGQLDEQSPLQQRGLVAELAQSESCVHDWGQIEAWRHSDCDELARLGSIFPAVAQQISPAPTLHCMSAVHVIGHSFSAVQIDVE
jgi:hypothetical protein